MNVSELALLILVWEAPNPHPHPILPTVFVCVGVLYTPGVFSWPAPCAQGLERLWPQSRQSEFGSCPSSSAGAALHTVGGVASGPFN